MSVSDEYNVEKTEVYLLDTSVDHDNALYRARELFSDDLEMEHADRVERHDDRIEMMLYDLGPIGLAIAPAKRL